MDRYSTHRELTRKVYSLIEKPKFVVEFGCGNYSTGFLIENSERGVSIEMQSSEWYRNISSQFKDCENWTFIEAIGPWNFLDFKFPEKIDLAFVDGHGDSRPECINLMMDKGCPVIISHDTEEPYYRWDKVYVNNGYKRVDSKIYTPYTSLWTTNEELFEKLK